MQLRWQQYPRSHPASQLSIELTEVFANNFNDFTSQFHKLDSNAVLAILADDLIRIGFNVERGKKKVDQIRIPVLFGQNGKVEKSFSADGYHPGKHYMLEIEAGRGVSNYQFLKDLFQACACDNVDALAIALRNDYRGSDDFTRAGAFIDTIFSSTRLKLPIHELLLIGY